MKLLNKLFLCVCVIFCLSACSNKSIPTTSSYIMENYPEYNQLSEIQNNDEEVILLKNSDSYKMLLFEKENNQLKAVGGIDEKTPFGKLFIQKNDYVHIIMFIDNSVLKADRFDFELQVTENEYITVTEKNLLSNEIYFIKSYKFKLPYNSITPFVFFDKDGKRIDIVDYY